MAELRIVFMGTPELACVSLEALLRLSDFKVVAVVTQPDRPKGRDLKLQASPVKELALKHGLPVLQPQKARDEAFIGELRSLGPDLIVVAAFGQILPKAMLEIPPYGCINVHTSLLPKYRGAGPIQWAILNDEKETGVTIMKMDVGMDTGDVITQDRTEITPEDNAQTLHERLAQMGAELLVRTIPDYVAGKIQPRPQPAEGVSLAPKIKKEEGRIDWQQPARVIWNRVRGLVPWPGAFTVLKEGQRLLKIWEAEIVEGKSGKPGEILDLDRTGIVVGCGDGAIRLTMVQLEGGKRLSAEQFLAGNRKAVGQGLG
ncbi:MAG TPA: methionyl-tRNA formyltransferase [Candidatus Dormibacteraeota bacterium]|nr:methionyl-tRNA formyltransferase [Candidatus Dormibacteraeota bacterium]